MKHFTVKRLHFFLGDIRRTSALTRLIAGFLALTATGIVAASAQMPSISAAASPSNVAPIERAIKSAALATSTPEHLTPSLRALAQPTYRATATGEAQLDKCNGFSNASIDLHPTICYFGDLESSKIVALVGDSNVGNWTPALNLGLAYDGYKLAVLTYAGCPTPDATYSHLPSGQGTGCSEWHSKVGAVVSALHPVAVLVASGEDFVSSRLSNRSWASGFAKLFAKSTYGDQRAARVVIGTSPFFSLAPPQCLVTHPDPQSCGISQLNETYDAYLTRDAAAARASHATLVKSEPWFCSDETCSVVIAKYLAFSDVDNVTIAYSDYIAPLVTDAIMAAIADHTK